MQIHDTSIKGYDDGPTVMIHPDKYAVDTFYQFVRLCEN